LLDISINFLKEKEKEEEEEEEEEKEEEVVNNLLTPNF